MVCSDVHFTGRYAKHAGFNTGNESSTAPGTQPAPAQMLVSSSSPSRFNSIFGCLFQKLLTSHKSGRAVSQPRRHAQPNCENAVNNMSDLVALPIVLRSAIFGKRDSEREEFSLREGLREILLFMSLAGFGRALSS